MSALREKSPPPPRVTQGVPGQISVFLSIAERRENPKSSRVPPLGLSKQPTRGQSNRFNLNNEGGQTILYWAVRPAAGMDLLSSPCWRKSHRGRPILRKKSEVTKAGAGHHRCDLQHLLLSPPRLAIAVRDSSGGAGTPAWPPLRSQGPGFSSPELNAYLGDDDR